MAKDFRKKTFGKILRGYAPEEVDEYLGYVTDEYRKVEHRAADAERKLALALKKLDEAMKAAELAGESNAEVQAQAQKKADETYMDAVREAQSVIAQAETTAMNIREAAAAEAESKLSEAEAAARTVMENAEADAKKIRAEAAAVHDAASEMYDEVCSFKAALFSLYSNHIASVESIEEAAKNYINGVDSVYTGATGEKVIRDDEDFDEDDDEGVETEAAEGENDTAETAVNSAGPAKNDIYIDIMDEEEEFADFSDETEHHSADEPHEAQPDKNEAELQRDDMAMTRVLRLSAISEAIANLEADEEYDAYEDSDEYGVDDYDDDGEEYDEDETESDDAGESEESGDFKNDIAAFMDLDSLFTSEPSVEYSQKDEFDIVFAEADSKRNIEEIRRQPIVPAEEPRNPKKHKKF